MLTAGWSKTDSKWMHQRLTLTSSVPENLSQKLTSPASTYAKTAWLKVKLWNTWMHGSIMSLTYKYHIKQKCKIAMYNIQRIKHIHYMLTEESCRILVQSLVISHLDYGNALFIGLPDCDLDKLQWIQNIAAKLILGRGRMDSPSEAMYHLHWLPIRQRIQHKIVMLTFKCISGEAPWYLRDMISVHHQSRPGLCSNDKNKRLHEYKAPRKTFADWSFKIAAPRL